MTQNVIAACALGAIVGFCACALYFWRSHAISRAAATPKRSYWKVAGAAHVYRCPFEQDGSWRVRRRTISSDVVKTFVIKNRDGTSPKNLRQAKKAVLAMAAEETRTATYIIRRVRNNG